MFNQSPTQPIDNPDDAYKNRRRANDRRRASERRNMNDRRHINASHVFEHNIFANNQFDDKNLLNQKSDINELIEKNKQLMAKLEGAKSEICDLSMLLKRLAKEGRIIKL